jgi:hypothetical protein
LLSGTRQRLEDHIDECGRLHRQLRRQVKSLSHQAENEFMAMRAERDRMHSENGAAIRELRAVVWKFGFAILGVLLGLAASQHI